MNFRFALPQGVLCVDALPSGKVHEGEEQVSDFFGLLLRSLGCYHLLGFLGNLGEDPIYVVPIEADAGRPFLHELGVGEGRRLRGNALYGGAFSAFRLLDHLPVALDFAGVCNFGVAEYVGMTPH